MTDQGWMSRRSMCLFARGCAVLVLAVGAAVLAGWWFDLTPLRQGFADWAPMRPWSAACSLLAGTALLLASAARTPARRAAAMLLAALLGAITVPMLAAPFVELPVFENFLLPDKLAAEPVTHAGRMVGVVALEFGLAAALAWLWAAETHSGSYTALATLGLAVALILAVGHLYTARSLYTAGMFTGTSVYAALTLLTLFAGFLAAKPDLAGFRVIGSASLGGIAARRLMPLVIAVPLGIGWVLARVADAYNLDSELVIALFAVAAVAMLLAVVLLVARQLSRIDDERRQALTSARIHQERLATAQEVAGAGAWDLDLVTDECTWSDSYYRLFGLHPGEVRPSHATFFACVHPDDRKALARALRHAIAEASAFESEYRIIRPDGRVRHMATLAKVHLGDDGKPVRVSGLNFDVTERVAMANALTAAKQEAERANLAKSKFLASASHDLRQPVQSLALFVGVLRDRVKDGPAAPVLGGIERSVDALRQMLDSLLDISRLDAGIIVPKPADVPLGPLLAALETEYAARATVFDLRLRTVKTSLAVRSDAVLLERMLRNLIENALRYTKAGGVVVGCRRKRREVLLSVCDSGIGISPEDQRVIFEEFYQVANPERDRAKGLGLGLAIVERISRLLGHPVRVTSTPGKGSCFTVVLPAVRAAAPSRPAAKLPAAHVDGDLVLVIEDEQLVRESLGAALSSWGYEVATAGSIAEAVAEVDHLPRTPSLLIADYRLRGDEVGPRAIEAVVRHCGRAIPGLIITGDTAPERLKEARAAGYALVHKPLSMDSLHRVVSSLTRH